jgi:flagellar biosynthesis protein FlhA
VDLARQLSKKWPLRIASGVMFLLAAFPGLPKFSFILAGSVVAWLSAHATDGTATAAEPAKDAEEKGQEPTQQQQLEGLLRLDEIHLEVGYALVPLVDQTHGGQLLQRIRALRRHLATQLGFLVPSVHITDNIRLKPREYVAELRGVEVARYELAQDRVLAISSDPHSAPLEGIDTREPAFGVAAKWIEPRLQDKALASGYAVVDQTSIIATHLAEIVRQHAHELLTRQETKRLLDALAESQPKLVEELVPRLLSLGELQRVLQLLLHEQVSIRDLPAILETVLDTAPANKNPVSLVEAVRQTLGRSLVTPLLGTDRKLRVLTLDPAMEDELSRSMETPAPPERTPAPATPLLRRLLDGLQRLVGDPVTASSSILLCHSPARFHLRRLLEPFLPRVVVLAPAEIPPGITVQSLGVIR